MTKGTVMRATYRGVTIAQSDDSIQLEGNCYFPPDSIDQRYLTRSWAKSLCLWKGIASYYDITVEDDTARRAAWVYRHPSPLARKIRNHVAFWGDVQVTH